MKSLISMPFESAAKRRKYINHDLADEVLKSYQIHILPDHKLIYDNVDVMEFAPQSWKPRKKIRYQKVLYPLVSLIFTMSNVLNISSRVQGIYSESNARH